MNELHRLRKLLFLGPLLIAQGAMAQHRAAPCFVSYDFETIDQFSGWEIGRLVETQTPLGVGLGEIVPAWEIGDAASANADGYFPVPDFPLGNSFVQANDAASPCNCDMVDVELTSPSFDLSGRTGVALEFRAFHEGTLGSGPAYVEARSGMDEWMVLDTIPPHLGAWQDVLMDLSALDGLPDVFIRFRWSDGGGWSSGFAMDDFCLRERTSNDLSVTRVIIGDPTVPAFDASVQTSPYRQLPVEQAVGVRASVEVVNRGTSVAQLDALGVELYWNGSVIEDFIVSGPGELQPGQRSLVPVTSAWVPSGPGRLIITGKLPAGVPDDDESDNRAQTEISYTAAGWDAGYGAMGVDNDRIEGRTGGTGNFTAANRMEIMNNGSNARGVSFMLATTSAVGEEVRGILLDENYTFVDTTTRHVITDEDMVNIWNGQPLYLSFGASPALPIGDHFVGIQHLETGDEGNVEIALGGEAPLGGSVLLDGLVFDVTYLHTAPLVRLHLSDLGVAVMEQDLVINDLSVYPSPMSTSGTIEYHVPHTGLVRLEVFASDGRSVHAEVRRESVGERLSKIDASSWASGLYSVRVAGDAWMARGSFVVLH